MLVLLHIKFKTNKIIQRALLAVLLQFKQRPFFERMIKMLVEGKYGQAKIFAENIDSGVVDQVRGLLDQDFVQGARVRIMPDCHVGMGCVIGFTADLGDKVIPNIVGVDIGCGMLTVELGKLDIDLERFDYLVNKWIPSSTNTHGHAVVDFEELKDLLIYDKLKNMRRIENSLGTLGGGNHFIELSVDDEDRVYLVIHSGSRNLGNQVAHYYQSLAIDKRKGKDDFDREKDQMIKTLKAAGKDKEIDKTLKKMGQEFKSRNPDYPRDLCYLEGEDREAYLHDMAICQGYASLNRKAMARLILDKYFGQDLEDFDHWETIHNYIDLDSNIIRKGAIRANEGEKVLIPLNMRDGSLICIGKGNPDWNNSAPHGSGRLMSRKEAYDKLDLGDFKKEMEGIYSSSIGRQTLDEAPAAYKPAEEIIGQIGDTVDIYKHIKPIYNFKAKD